MSDKDLLSVVEDLELLEHLAGDEKPHKDEE
jgi:hypothetical protein